MPTDPLAASRYPAVSAAPNIPQDIQNAVLDLADDTIPTFATETARNTAYAAWVSAGGAMRDGLRCYVTNLDQFHIYEGGAWRFWKYAGPIFGTATPITNIAFGTKLIPNQQSTVCNGWAVDRSHNSMSVNTTSGQVTFNQRGVWTFTGRFFSDGGPNRVAGTSAVSVNMSAIAYPLEDTRTRNAGGDSAILRQPISWTGYVDAGVTWQAAVFQVNNNAEALSYAVNFSFQLIG